MNEELIEEITEVIRAVYTAGKDDKLPDASPQRYASGFITRILQAVVDGLPLPGEVGRWHQSTDLYAHDWMQDVLRGESTMGFIAYRKEGKGEAD